MASDIAVAFIGGGAGLLTGAVTGAISSLIAPWANWGVEKRRLAQEQRRKRIENWNTGVGNLEWAERNEGVIPQFRSDPVTADVLTRDWFITLRPVMAKDVLRQVEKLSAEPTNTRLGQIPSLLKHEIARIERDKWKLI